MSRSMGQGIGRLELLRPDRSPGTDPLTPGYFLGDGKGLLFRRVTADRAPAGIAVELNEGGNANLVSLIEVPVIVQDEADVGIGQLHGRKLAECAPGRQ